MIGALSLALALSAAAPAGAATATVAAVEPPLSRDDVELSFRLAAGAEWDSNARRTVSRELTDPTDGDAVARLIAEVDTNVTVSRTDRVALGYVLGTKRFFGVESEDLLAHSLTAGTFHGLSKVFSANSFGSLRAMRMRSGRRDYTIGSFGAGGAFHFSDFTLSSNLAYTTFDFIPDQRLSYAGPSAAADLTWRPAPRLSFSAHADHYWRNYRGNAIVTAELLVGNVVNVRPTFCDGSDGLLPPACAARERDDRELGFGVRGGYRGKLHVSGEYLFRIQRSSSDYENIDRHRAAVHGAFPLPLDLTLNFFAALQLNSGRSATETLLLAEDDENQSTVQVGLSRKIGDALALEVRYALFANQFTTAEFTFVRQTFYSGLSYRLGD
jgi:hypothetical protein